MHDAEAVLRGFAEHVDRLDGPIELAKLVCRETQRALELFQCEVRFFAISGRPVISVDNCPDQTDEHRLAYLTAGWQSDPMHRAIAEHHRPVGDELLGLAAGSGPHGTTIHTLALPIVEPAGLLGMIRCDHLQPFSRDLERDLFAMATIISVRLVQLGITAFDDSPHPALLTPRQYEISRLAARGYSNPEIADELGISLNTVKNRLKESFDRLDVCSRVELVDVLRRTRPSLELGVSHDGPLTIVCVPRLA